MKEEPHSVDPDLRIGWLVFISDAAHDEEKKRAKEQKAPSAYNKTTMLSGHCQFQIKPFR